LNRARGFALDILSRLRGERIGVFLFASKGVEVVPFTRDYGFCRYVLTYINDAEITVPGSDLGEALQAGISMFEEDGTQAARILVLLSDGEDIRPEPSFFSESAMLAAKKRVRVFTVGIGTGKGVLIPVRSPDGTKIVNHYIDEQGDHLKTRLEQGPLTTIAKITGGEYFSAAEPNGPEALMKSILREARDVEHTMAKEPGGQGCGVHQGDGTGLDETRPLPLSVRIRAVWVGDVGWPLNASRKTKPQYERREEDEMVNLFGFVCLRS
jgi:Ca-activated chloride channel family protein